MSGRDFLSPDVAKYWELANAAFERLRPHFSPEDRPCPGGTFAYANDQGIPFFAFRLGRPPLDKQMGRWNRAQEKCYRAAIRQEGSSRPSRNPTLDRYAGAVQGNLSGNHASFSGLWSENQDEILAIDILVRAGDMTSWDAKRLLRSNTDFNALKHLYDWADWAD